MTSMADPGLMATIRRYGAFDVTACFSCGTCTVACPLSTPTTSFPRKLIHYAQLGLRDKLVGRPDVWLCESCGECTDTCPRDAKPSEFMIALRKYEIAELGVPAFTHRLLTSRAFAASFLAALSLLLMGILALIQRPADLTSVALFGFLPEQGVEIIGIAVGVVALGTALVGVLRLWRSMARAAPRHEEAPASGVAADTVPRAQTTVPTLRDVLVQRRTQTCAAENHAKRWWHTRWFGHLAVFWGFLGLLLATILRFVALPIHGGLVPPWEPVRLLGIVSGALLLYGTAMMIVRRVRKADRYTSRSTFMDWTFILFLFLAGLGGFLVDIAQYAGLPFWAYAFMLFHLVVVFDLLVLLPFTKFAHVVYRPVALWLSRVYGQIS
ncbi:MAG TPA: 4Fe-4S dicluster domain-containing protein [Thermoplasmata archaeon]|nr:4Fe-4S dicluster domain-containing protein [Thermoplasmata archaeon]